MPFLKVFAAISIFFGGLLVFTTFTSTPTFSQETNASLGMTNYYQVAEDVSEGDIVVVENDQIIKKSSHEYEKLIFGVVNNEPAISVNPGVEGLTPIASQGVVKVRVTNTNGEILRGDYITTSNIPGVGMKMRKDSYSIGLVQEDLKEVDENNIGMVFVEVNPGYVNLDQNLEKDRTFFKRLFAPSGNNPEANLGPFRYVIGGGIMLATLVFVILSIRKISRQAMVSVGRNPLASKVIFLSVLLNVIVTFVIAALGFALGYIVFTY